MNKNIILIIAAVAVLAGNFFIPDYRPWEYNSTFGAPANNDEMAKIENETTRIKTVYEPVSNHAFEDWINGWEEDCMETKVQEKYRVKDPENICNNECSYLEEGKACKINDTTGAIMYCRWVTEDEIKQECYEDCYQDNGKQAFLEFYNETICTKKILVKNVG